MKGIYVVLGLATATLVACGDEGGVFDVDATGDPPRVDASADADAASASPDGGASSCDRLPEPPGEEVVDLGDEGLAEGDVIDSYLEEWVQDGHQVRIPAGRYEWQGEGFTGKSLADASVVGEGEVIFDASDGHAFSSNFTPEGGDFELRNITIRGQRASGANKIRVYVPDPDATLVFRNFNIPDGSEDDGASGIFVNKRHAGTFELIDAHIEGFADNGLYASSPSQSDGENGEVHVVRGLFRNNNISNVRIGTDRSSVRGSVIVQDAPAPANSGAHNQRGLRVRQHATGDDIEIEDVHITQTESGNGALVIEGDDGGSGTITGARIRNEISTAPIRIRNDSEWSASSIDITGEGDLEPVGGNFSEICQGESCAAPATTKPEVCSG